MKIRHQVKKERRDNLFFIAFHCFLINYELEALQLNLVLKCVLQFIRMLLHRELVF